MKIIQLSAIENKSERRSSRNKIDSALDFVEKLFSLYEVDLKFIFKEKICIRTLTTSNSCDFSFFCLNES